MTTPLLRRPGINTLSQSNAGAPVSQPGVDGGRRPSRPSRPAAMTMPVRRWRALVSCIALALPLVSIAQTVTVKPTEAGLRVEIDGVVFTEYVTKDTARPYLYPLVGAAGVNVSRDFPMKKDTPGEAKFLDHPHHRSLWFGHSRINEINFWAEYQVFGQQVHSGFADVRSTANQGRFTATTQWIGPDKKTVLTDERRITITALPGGEKTLDFDITLKATTGDVLIGDTKEGTIALRLCPSLSMNSSKSGVNTGPSTGHAFNSQGVRDVAIWGKRANWVCYYGPDPKGNAVGVVIFSHPKNLQSPSPWHARDYGLFAANPFGLHDFEPDKPAGAGDYTIKQGGSLTLRYRFYFAKGTPSAEALENRFKDYAQEK